ncbi:ACT domain-containing protein [Tenacibaculum sp. 190524A02b]|uniref:ACT domain-containing protein n=1 Tax=Tenacibaculum vairaonense TaxID=3137860 RepID=UPI0031FA7D1F
MIKNTGVKNLQELLKNMKPILNEGNYVFTSVNDINSIPRELAICEMREQEGHTVILLKEKADQLGLTYEYIASWITLTVHSSLEAVGLTAAFATALGNNNISCNVVAGYYHDHIFIDKKDTEKAMEVLTSLSKTI